MTERSESAPLVLIASGIARLRKRWRLAIRGLFAFDEVTERNSLERSLANRRPIALLLDLHLPELGGVDGVARILRHRPTTPIVLLTSRPDDREAIAALRAGARGYCDRGIDPGLLVKALGVVQNGEIWIGRKLIPHLLEELAALGNGRPQTVPAEQDGGLDRLTPRNREVVRLLSGGASNKEIATQLHVTQRTVKAHLTATFRKLGVSGRLQLAVLVLEHLRRPGGPGQGPGRAVVLPPSTLRWNRSG